MDISYYTVDDLRLPPKRAARGGWTMEAFPTLGEALDRYRALPPSGIKALGLTDGVHTLELVKCQPLFPDDREGEDILASDYRQFPLWANCPEAERASSVCIAELDLRYALTGKMISPIPSASGLSEDLQNKYLWLNMAGEFQSAIRGIYVAGTGWVSPDLLDRHASPPLVLKYRADGITEQGGYLALEVEPWEYELLALRTKERLDKEGRDER